MFFFFLYKDNASRVQSSLLKIAEAPPVLYKDNASRVQSSLLEIAEAPLVLYKDNASRVQQRYNPYILFAVQTTYCPMLSRHNLFYAKVARIF